METGPIFFRGQVYLAANGPLVFLTGLYCVVVGAASRGYDFDLSWDHSGREEKINATRYIHNEKVLGNSTVI